MAAIRGKSLKTLGGEVGQEWGGLLEGQIQLVLGSKAGSGRRKPASAEM